MKKNDVCPVEYAGALDLGLRRLLQNPYKILKPYISEGMTVLDVGCDSGFFTIDAAKLVGESGKVIAADLQKGMLARVKAKISKYSFEKRVDLHLCQKDTIGLSVKSDLILIFYMLHEVPDQSNFLKELKQLLKADGKILIVEPKFHVTKSDFKKSKYLMEQTGYNIVDNPKILFSHSVLIQKTKE